MSSQGNAPVLLNEKKLKDDVFFFFCDVSGSMDIYTRMILQFVHALHHIDRRTEVFFFQPNSPAQHFSSMSATLIRPYPGFRS